MKVTAVIIIALAVLIALLFFLNNTPLFYSEPSSYNRNKEPAVMSKEAEEVFYTNKHSDKLVILIHGFPGTPNEWKRVGLLLSKDYNVYIPRLYGFGTKKEFFEKTYFTQWYKALKDSYRDYRKKYDDVTVCGLSFGGMMTLRLAEDFGKSKDLAMKKIVVISAPVFLNNIRVGIVYNPLLYFTRTLSWFIREVAPDKEDQGIDNDGADWIGYHEKFPKQIYSMQMGMRVTRHNLGRINLPVLLMQCRGDKTVPFENMDYIYRHISSKDKKEFEFNLDGWKHTRHLLTQYNSTYMTVYTNMIEFIGK